MNPTPILSEPASSQRRGKIARLPRAIREQLNSRLDDGLEAAEILPWLNDLPEVREIVTQRFNGAPISPQNLSAWRHGGFEEWLIQRELLNSASHMLEHVQEMQDTIASDSPDGIPHPLADYMLSILTVHFARFLARWNGGPGDIELTTLIKVGQFTVKLQQAAYRAEKGAFERRQTRDEAASAEATRLDMLAAWPKYCEMKKQREEAEKLRAEEKAQKAARRKPPVQQQPTTEVEPSPVKVN